MSDLQCAATAVLLDASAPGTGDLDAALRGQRIAAVIARADRAAAAESWAQRLDLPRRQLAGGTLTDRLAELADEFRGESILVLVEPADLAALGATAGTSTAALALDADGRRLSPWPVTTGR